MSSRVLNVAIAAALALVLYVAFALPASAATRTFQVRLASGSVITVKVDAPCVPMNQVAGLPGTPTGVPNFVIQKFKVPIFLLPIYQAAGIQYGVRWEVLAAINEIETDYGRNLNVSSAGAVGWMQFIPSTWKLYGTDGNNDGKADPYNPVDAIFSAARYLKAAGAQDNIRRVVF